MELSSGFVCPECARDFATAYAGRKHFREKHASRQRRPTKRSLEAVDDDATEQEALVQQQGRGSGLRRVHAGEVTAQDLLHNALNVTSSGGGGSSSDVTEVQKAELNQLIGLTDKISRVQINQIKTDVASHNKLRGLQIVDYLQAKLDECGFSNNATLDEMTSEVLRIMEPWQGMQTENQENRLRGHLYPHVTPRRRSLRSGGGKSGLLARVRERFVYDMPVEDRIEQEWRLNPHQYYRSQTFLQQQQLRQASFAGLVDDWVIDDYYSAVNGINHPQLGKSTDYLGCT